MIAAERLFLQQGVGTTTVEQITSSADVAKGTFYLYFSSKDDVLIALGDRYGLELLAKIKAAVSEIPEQEWRGKLSAWARAFVFGYLDSMRLHDIVFYGYRPATREGMLDNVIVDHLLNLLRTGVEAGAWSIDDPGFTTVFL
ncbi:MAG: TetR/AcrR family transcriptional regulator, partial [Stellaceae bacterium]